MKRWRWYRRWLNRAATVLATASLAILLGCGELKAQAMRLAAARSVRGTVESMTTAPRGEIDGAVLDDGTILHWPPHLEDQFTAVVKKGDRITAVGRVETTRKGDTHFEVQTITNVDSDATAENDGPPPPRKKGRKGAPPAPRRRGPEQTIQGTVERLNTAPKGEIDGAVLDDGTLLHWPPHLEDRFANLIAEGDRVKAVGFEETGKRGEERFEVQSLTNLRTNQAAENDDLGPPPRRETRRGRNEEPSSRSERIRQLKQEIERIEREVERLERDL
jgi:hypothetical protein